jgi:hypothetical protein
MLPLGGVAIDHHPAVTVRCYHAVMLTINVLLIMAALLTFAER